MPTSSDIFVNINGVGQISSFHENKILQLEKFIKDLAEIEVINKSKPFRKFLEFENFFDEEDIEMKVANMREEMERQMKDYDDPDPDGNPQSLFGRFIRFMGRTTGLNKHGPFKKVGKFIRNTSDIATGTLDDIENFIFKVIFGMEEDGEPFHKKVGREFNVLFTNFRKNFSKAVFGDENSLGDKIEDGKGLVNYAVEEVQKGFHSFSNLLFGKEIDEGNEALQTKSFNSALFLNCCGVKMISFPQIQQIALCVKLQNLCFLVLA